MSAATSLPSARRGRSVRALLVVALTACGAVSAQPLPGSVEFGAGAGRFFGGSFARGSNELFDRKVLADQDILRGFWLGGQLSRDWGVEIAARRTETHLVEARGGVFPNRPALAVFIPATVELLALRSFPIGSFVPAVGFGAGFMNVEVDTEDPSVRDVNRLCLSLTAGARFYAARWIGARIDVRGRATYLGARRLGEDRGWTDSGRWFVDAELLGGIFVALGGRS